MSDTFGLRDIQASGTLRVPVAMPATTGVAAPVVDAKPSGSAVGQGETLAGAGQSSPAVLAPAGGTVTGVAEVQLTSGRRVPAISLNVTAGAELPPPSTVADGAAKLTGLLRDAKPAALSRYVDVLRDAGVWADRWTSPDLLGQLIYSLKRPVDTILCNALDFDAALPLQQTLVCEYALEVVTAVSLLAALTNATRATIAVDAGIEGACAAAVQRVGAGKGVRVVGLRNDYPQANPTLLLHTLLRRPLRAGHLPTEAGVLLLDAAAAVLAGRALLHGESALRAPIGVADLRPGAATRRVLLNVPLGMTAGEVMCEAGVAPGAFELRGSSPIRDLRLPADCVISAGGELALYVVSPQPYVNPAPCIRCGWCTSGCPVHIHPAGILQAAQLNDRLAGERHGLDSCIECGICSYVCPSFLPLLGGIRSLRAAERQRV